MDSTKENQTFSVSCTVICSSTRGKGGFQVWPTRASIAHSLSNKKQASVKKCENIRNLLNPPPPPKREENVNHQKQVKKEDKSKLRIEAPPVLKRNVPIIKKTKLTESSKRGSKQRRTEEKSVSFRHSFVVFDCAFSFV